MTARGIAERLVRAHGIDYAIRRVQWRKNVVCTMHRHGQTYVIPGRAAAVTLWDAVLAALEGGR